MEYTLDAYGGKYNLKWLDDHTQKNNTSKSGNKQWWVATFPIATIPPKKNVEKYAKTRILEALNSEDSFGALLALKEKWYGGEIEAVMEGEIKQGTYTFSRSIRYSSKKGFTGFYDELDPTYKLRIPAEKCEYIAEAVRAGLPLDTMYGLLGLECPIEELEEYIYANREGMLDASFRFIAKKSNEDGFIDYVRQNVPVLKEKNINSFRITPEV